MLLSDSNGTSPGTPVLTIVDYYAIHKLVQTYIVEELGGAAAMEVYIKAEDGRKGFLDVYDPVDSSYYEVKSEKASSKLSTERQMQRYDNYKGRSYRARSQPRDKSSFGKLLIWILGYRIFQ